MRTDMKLYLEEEKEKPVYVKKAMAPQMGRTPVGINQFTTQSPPSAIQTGGPRITLSVSDALKDAKGSNTYTEKAAGHYQRALKVMQEINKMVGEGQMDKERYGLMKKLHGMHSDLADRFTQLLDTDVEDNYADGLMAASSYANRAHDILENKIQVSDAVKNISVPTYSSIILLVY